MKIDIPADVYADIVELIDSEASPVGIEAKKTHIIILHKLIGIERRLARLEWKDSGCTRTCARISVSLGASGGEIHTPPNDVFNGRCETFCLRETPLDAYQRGSSKCCGSSWSCGLYFPWRLSADRRYGHVALSESATDSEAIWQLRRADQKGLGFRRGRPRRNWQGHSCSHPLPSRAVRREPSTGAVALEHR